MPKLRRSPHRRGLGFIDTADIYGNDASEEIIAEALHPYRDNLLIATKGGFVPGERKPGEAALPTDGRPERLKAVCEASLKRLRVECIDLYQLHAPDTAVPYEDSIGALAELRKEGKIAHIGVSNVNRKQLATARSMVPVASVQNRYNHNDRSSEKVLEMCEESDIAFLPWGPIQTGDDAALQAIATEIGALPQQVALAWLLRRSPLMLPIPGTSSAIHLEENMKAAGLNLDDNQLARLSG